MKSDTSSTIVSQYIGTFIIVQICLLLIYHEFHSEPTFVKFLLALCFIEGFFFCNFFSDINNNDNSNGSILTDWRFWAFAAITRTSAVDMYAGAIFFQFIKKLIFYIGFGIYIHVAVICDLFDGGFNTRAILYTILNVALFILIVNEYPQYMPVNFGKMCGQVREEISNFKLFDVDFKKEPKLHDALENLKNGKHELAFNIFKKLADATQDKEAQYWCGVCYEQSYGVLKNDKLKFEMYQKSANQDYARAQYKLGFCYLDGTGVQKDPDLAFSWMKKSADQNYSYALYTLGNFYMYGVGTRKNLNEAKKYLHKASKLGNKDADELLAKIEKTRK